MTRNPNTWTRILCWTQQGAALIITPRKTCYFIWPVTPTTNPYYPSATPDYLDIVIIKDLTSLVYVTSFSALRSHYVTVLIVTTWSSSFPYPLDCPDSSCTDWSNFQAHLEDGIPSKPQLHKEVTIHMFWENVRHHSGRLRSYHSLDSPAWWPAVLNSVSYSGWNTLEQFAIQAVVYHLHPTFNAEDNRLQRSMTLQLNDWRNDPLNATIHSRHLDDQSQLKMAKRLMRVPNPVTSPGQTRAYRSLELGRNWSPAR